MSPTPAADAPPAAPAAPADLVAVGRVGDASGVRGDIKVIPFSADGAALLAAREWWLEGPARAPRRSVGVLSAKAHGSVVKASLMGLADRDAAAALKGAQVLVPRSRFPVLAEQEFYWVDLIGLAVVNEAGVSLGTVAGLVESGAHDILDVRASEPDGSIKQRLIPFVDAFVRTVDRAGRHIVVAWEPDY